MYFLSTCSVGAITGSFLWDIGSETQFVAADIHWPRRVGQPSIGLHEYYDQTHSGHIECVREPYLEPDLLSSLGGKGDTFYLIRNGPKPVYWEPAKTLTDAILSIKYEPLSESVKNDLIAYAKKYDYSAKDLPLNRMTMPVGHILAERKLWTKDGKAYISENGGRARNISKTLLGHQLLRGAPFGSVSWDRKALETTQTRPIRRIYNA